MTLRIAPPPPCSIICRPAARPHRKPPSSTIEVTARQPFGDRSSALTTKLPAASFTNTSTRPNRVTAAATSASTCSGMRTSVGCASPSPPTLSISATVSSSGSGRRPATTTAAPRRANSTAIARPMPLPPPVTTATWPSKLPLASIALSLLPHDHPGIERERARRRDQERVDLDLGDVRPRRRHLRERGRGPGGRRHVERRPAAHARQERRPAQRAQQPLCGDGVERRQVDRDVLEHLGVDPAQPHHRDRPEACVGARADDQLDALVQRRHPLERERLRRQPLGQVVHRDDQRCGFLYNDTATT